jgi:hypothetical protein
MIVRIRTGGRRATRRALSAGALVLAALLAAACSSSPSSPQVPSLSGHTTPASNIGYTQAQSDQDMISFTRCMRAHGISIHDPVHRAEHAGLSVDVPQHDNATRAGWAACGHFLAKTIQLKEAGARAQVAQELPQLLAYARCMRSHDINMLDPNAMGGLNLGRVPGITSNFGRYSPQFRSADAACRHLLPAGVHDNGSGP